MHGVGFTVLTLSVVVLGCSDTGGESAVCLDPLPTDCVPLYEPTYDNVFEQTFKGCSVGGSACHSEQGAKGGLVLSDKELAYTSLLNPPATAPRVIAGDPECSSLVHRLESTDNAVVMPPGNPLSASERCAIEQWIRQGAHP